MKNPFDILGVPRSSSKNTAKSAYRKLVMLHHPDKGGDSEKFKEIQSAWELIESSVYIEEHVPTLQTKTPTQNTFWDIPVDIGWRARPAPINKVKPQKPKTPWKFTATADHIEFSEALQIEKPSALLGEFTINVSPQEAFNGFSYSITINGNNSHKLTFEAGIPHGFKKNFEIDSGHVIILINIQHSILKFKSVDLAKSENTIISGIPTAVLRTAEVVSNISVPPTKDSFQIEGCNGEHLQVLIPTDHDRIDPLYVIGYGYYDWFPEFNKCGSVRGNLKINFI